MKSWCMALGETSKQAGTKNTPPPPPKGNTNQNQTVPLALERTDRSARGEPSPERQEGGERTQAPLWRCRRAAPWEGKPVGTGTWEGFRDTSKRSGAGEASGSLPSALRACRESKPQHCWCVRARCVSLGWLSSEKDPSCPRGTRARVQGRAEIRIPTGNPAGDRVYQPRTSQVAMLRRYTVRGGRHLPPFP